MRFSSFFLRAGRADVLSPSFFSLSGDGICDIKQRKYQGLPQDGRICPVFCYSVYVYADGNRRGGPWRMIWDLISIFPRNLKQAGAFLEARCAVLCVIAFGTAGTYAIILAALMISLVLITQRSIFDMIRKFSQSSLRVCSKKTGGEKGSGKTSPGRRGEAGRAGGKTETPQGKISRGKGKKSGNRKEKKEKRSGCS